MTVRVGHGRDLHRTDDGRPLVLGGVLIEEGPGLAGHSDADVLLHAITDALLGAIGRGDLGSHFPPDDPRWKDADSADFLRKALAWAESEGWELVNVDATVVAERPRLRPYVEHLRRRIAEILRVEPGAVNVKVKSGEGLGPIGAGLAMEAEAVVLVAKRTS